MAIRGNNRSELNIRKNFFDKNRFSTLEVGLEELENREKIKVENGGDGIIVKKSNQFINSKLDKKSRNLRDYYT